MVTAAPTLRRGRVQRDLGAVLAGLLVGTLVLGVGGRLAMTGLALAARSRPRYSWAGSIEVVVLGVIYGLVGGVLLAVLRRAGFRSGVREVVLLGTGMTAVAWLSSPVARQMAAGSPIAFPWLVAASLAVFSLYAAAAGRVADRLCQTDR